MEKRKTKDKKKEEVLSVFVFFFFYGYIIVEIEIRRILFFVHNCAYLSYPEYRFNLLMVGLKQS